MDEVFISKGSETCKSEESGKLFRMLMKSKKMEAVISEMDAGAESKWYEHDGEEIHILLKGKVEYTIGKNTYKMEDGDALWHRSDLPHRAKNIGQEKAVYLTVGSPPTFM